VYTHTHARTHMAPQSNEVNGLPFSGSLNHVYRSGAEHFRRGINQQRGIYLHSGTRKR